MPKETFSQKKQRSQHIFELLLNNHPRLSTFLTHKNTFELLIAVILSAQCTDERVNLTTPNLFKQYPTKSSQCHPLHGSGVVKLERICDIVIN